MSDYLDKQRAENERKKQTEALQAQARAMDDQTRLIKQQQDQQRVAQSRQEAIQNKQLKNQKRANNKQAGKSNFHGIYCLLIGWWVGLILICCIVPLFSQGGRSLIKKAFGFW